MTEFYVVRPGTCETFLMRRFHRVIAVVESLVLVVLWPNEVKPGDGGMAPVNDRCFLLRIGAQR
jgi:hypothetical protein